MGSIKTSHVKKLGHAFMKKYSDRFSRDYDANKAVLANADIKSKWLRNRLAGYLVRLKGQEGRRVSAPVKETVEEE